MKEMANAPGLAPIMGGILPYFIAIIFLIIGLLAAVSSAPKGANIVIKAAGKWGKATGKWATKKGWDKTKTWAREKTPERIKRLGEKMSAVRGRPSWGEGEKGTRSWFKRRAGDLAAGIGAPITGSLRGVGKAIGPRVSEARGKAIAKAEAEAEKMDSPHFLLSEIRKELSKGNIDRPMGLLSGGINKGGGFLKLLQDEKEGLTKNEQVKLGLEANKIGAIPVAERIGRAFVNQANEMGFKFSDEDKKRYVDVKEKLIGEATKDQIKDFGKNFWKSAENMEAVLKFWGGPQVGKAADEFGRKFVDDYMSVIEKTKADDLIRVNPKAALYITGFAAQDLGFNAPEGLPMDKIKEKIKETPKIRDFKNQDLVSLRSTIRELYPSVISLESGSKEKEEEITKPLTVKQALKRKKKEY